MHSKISKLEVILWFLTLPDIFEDIELEILFDDPGDSLTFTFTDAPSQFPNWA